MKYFFSRLALVSVFAASFLLPISAATAASVSISGCVYQGGVCICYQNGQVTVSNNPGACSQLSGVFGTILYIINDILVPLIFALAFIVFLWGVFKAYILGGADETAREKGHQLILWGIIGFVVMISLWGLVNVVSNTFGLGGGFAPPPPTL